MVFVSVFHDFASSFAITMCQSGRRKGERLVCGFPSLEEFAFAFDGGKENGPSLCFALVMTRCHH